MRISVQIEQETQRPAGWTLTTYSDPNGKPKTGRLDLTLHTPRPEQETQRPTGWTSTTTPTWTEPVGLVPLSTPKSAGCQSSLGCNDFFNLVPFPSATKPITCQGSLDSMTFHPLSSLTTGNQAHPMSEIPKNATDPADQTGGKLCRQPYCCKAEGEWPPP